MGEERRGGVVQSGKVANPSAGMSNRTSAKPYVIAKRAVWEAYQQVKANRGAAGIDDETIAMFEQNLSKNLYKLWNRMSSGSYFPPPVKQVEIPKAKGLRESWGSRLCRIGLRKPWSSRSSSRRWTRCFILIHMDIGPDGRPNKRLQSPESGAGNTIGWSSLISRGHSITSIMSS